MSERRSTVAEPDLQSARRFVLTEEIRYGYSAPVTNLRQRLKVVPPTAHGPQRRRRWRLTVDGVPAADTRIRLDRFGNLTVDVVVPQVDETVAFLLAVDVATDVSGAGHHLHIDRGHYGRSRLTASDDRVAALAADARGARTGDVGALCAGVHRSIEYQWGTTGVRTTAAEALAGGRGVCQDYAHIMLAACHVLGLTARYVSGHLAGEGGSHAWVEVLHQHPTRPDTWSVEGWDPTHDRPTNPDYLVVAVGRDYADVAPLTGSYEGVGVTNVLDVDKRLTVN